jgi:hypothetical protein
MKLAFANVSIVRLDALRGVGLCKRAAANTFFRTASIRPLKARHKAGCLVAHWHVSPETGRVECRWSVEEAPADDSLCRRLAKTAMRSHVRAHRHGVRSRCAQAERDRAA